MTINASQAIDIAAEYTEREPISVSTDGKDFVVSFANSDPYDNLPVLVDAETGEPKPLSAQEYTAMMDTLVPAE